MNPVRHLLRNPLTRQRWARFRRLRRAWWSLLLLTALYLVSLTAECWCNDRPLLVCHRGRLYFPVFFDYPDDAFTGSGRLTRPDYRALAQTPDFARGGPGRMIFPPHPYGPLTSVSADTIRPTDGLTLRFTPAPRVGALTLDMAGRIRDAEGLDAFAGPDAARDWIGRAPGEIGLPADALAAALAERFANRPAPAVVIPWRAPADGAPARLQLTAFTPRAASPATIRALLRDDESAATAPRIVRLDTHGAPRAGADLWATLPDDLRAELTACAGAVVGGAADTAPIEWRDGIRRWRITAVREEVRFPFRPVAGHPLGLDSSGRDVLARMFYGLRTALTFGLLLTLAATLLGTLLGGLMGYYGGRVDLVGQRLTEIWDALPFLYVLILMGSVFGRGFWLLLICYALFNWIGISYYLRAEFLRLRRQPFIESARGLGLGGARIMFRHILPNALAPIITFFPFQLVGAIGLLAALDYLGFGLPPPTPSWGELLAQAQEYPWAWWLALYPTLALMGAILLGVFIGEGVRSAYDPRRPTRLE